MNEQALARKKLLEEELARYVRVLSRTDNPDRVIVFGSLATGQVHEWSDIDLVIVNQTRLPYLERLYKVQDLLHPQVGTDILYYTPDEFIRLCQERPFFQEEILKKGRVVYERHN